MGRRANIIGRCRDLFGCEWDIRESRPTRYGFDLQIGCPIDAQGHRLSGQGHGGPRLVPTRSLYRYWWRLHRACDGRIYDLPIARSSVKRVRALLDLNLYAQYRRWWMQHIEDLHDLTCTEFAKRYGLHLSDGSKTRRQFFGARKRAVGWWRDPEIAVLLQSNLPHVVIAERLGISIGASRRLRSILRHTEIDQHTRLNKADSV